MTHFKGMNCYWNKAASQCLLAEVYLWGAKVKPVDANAVYSTTVDADRSSVGKYAFVFAGSMVNAMKYIFAEKKYFYRQVNHLPLSTIDDRDAIEHIIRGFRSSGKVIERDLALGACKLFRADMWYLNQFFSICDSLSKGSDCR